VALHLPVKLRLKGINPATEGSEEEEEWEAEWDQDNVAAKTEDSVADEITVTWIGAVTPSNVFGTEFTFDPSPKRIAGIQKCLNAMNCIPVFLDQTVYDLQYAVFSKNVLWDIFHNVLRPRNVATEGAYEKGFVPGNQRLAEITTAHLQRSDIVWVHDYHLMLVPKMLRDRGHEGPIIFFLHVPFPTSEIFRTLPMRHELLEGMLSSSTIGFHTFNHGRHFLTACRRFLGAQSRSAAQGTLAVEHRDRRVLITISHLGVDPQRLSISTSPTTKEASRKIVVDLPQTATFKPGAPAVIFGSLDEMQRLKGVPLKLLAFERFLSQFYNKWRDGQARFVLWTIKRSGARQHDVERSTREVRRLVERINEQYGPVVIHREFDSRAPPTLEERVALWLSLDVYVSTAVAEGLNLFPLEYMYCRSEENPGIVILSEFSASSSVLNGAVRVNCYDIGYIAKAMDETARMPIDERRARRARDVDYVTTKASQWTRHVINEVLGALEDEDFSSTTIAQLPAFSSSGVALLHTVQCKPLRYKDVIRAYSSAQRRVFFLDFGGTLVEREEENLTLKKDFLGAMGRGLSDGMRQCLEKLCRDDQKNIVFIVSGDTRTVLTRVFFDLLNQGVPLGLVAHSGLCIRLPRKDFLKTVASSQASASVIAAAVAAVTQARSAEDKNTAAMNLTAKMSILQEKQYLDKLHLESLTDEEKAFLHHESHLLRQLSDPLPPRAALGSGLDTLDAAKRKTMVGQLDDVMKQKEEEEEEEEEADVSKLGSSQVDADGTQLGGGLGAAPGSALDLPSLATAMNSTIGYDWMMTIDISKEWANWMREAGIIPILRKYTWSTVGTFYRTSGITSLWDYTFADPEWGLSQANFMILELEAAIANANLNIVVKHNKSTVQLLPKNVDKGSAVRRVLSLLEQIQPGWEGKAPDFCLCLGDDTSDEMMFQAVHQYFTSQTTSSSVGMGKRSQMFTATIGRKPTTASYYLRDTDAVYSILKELVDAGVA